MICKNIYIDKYNWEVHCYFAVDTYYTKEILKKLRTIGCSKSIYNRVADKMEKNEPNAGFTYSNKYKKETVMVVGLATSSSEYVNSITHELRHLCDDIASVYNIPNSGEEIAYLTGDIGSKLAHIISSLVCECPRCKYKRLKNIKYK